MHTKEAIKFALTASDGAVLSVKQRKQLLTGRPQEQVTFDQPQ
jgi:hypothetical protein